MSQHYYGRERQLAYAAMASIAEHEVSPTPQNYHLWYDYHAGANDALKHDIDHALASGRSIDNRMMYELGGRYLTSQAEYRAIEETSKRIQETLDQVVQLVADTGQDVADYGESLREVEGQIPRDMPGITGAIAKLIVETRDMSERSEQRGRELGDTAQRIAELEQQLEQARNEAITDGLTGLSNRRAFDTQLEALAAGTSRGMSTALLMIDVDHFKRVNDKWGHVVGDAVLKMVAEMLAKHSRPQDHLARYGGEEFAMLLPDTSIGIAASIAERLRTAIEHCTFNIRDHHQPIGGITVSIGAGCHQRNEDPTQWVGRCDDALYRAKTEGRNRVVLASFA